MPTFAVVRKHTILWSDTLLRVHEILAVKTRREPAVRLCVYRSDQTSPMYYRGGRSKLLLFSFPNFHWKTTFSNLGSRNFPNKLIDPQNFKGDSLKKVLAKLSRGVFYISYSDGYIQKHFNTQMLEINLSILGCLTSYMISLSHLYHLYLLKTYKISLIAYSE